MKKLALMSLFVANFVIAAPPTLEDLTKDEVKDVGREFAGNFIHSTVAAPETDGLWGVEVGFTGGRSSSPDLKDVINRSGGDGGDFKNIYHASLMARAHFPFDLFAELTYLPKMDISDVEVGSLSLAAGWNAGGYFSLPLDWAIGVNYSQSEVSFTQDPTDTLPKTTIDLDTKSFVYWTGISKTFLFFTPYLKVGWAQTEADVSATGEILAYSSSRNESVTSTGSYLALGANLQFLLTKLGVEASQVVGVKRLTAKLSLDF